MEKDKKNHETKKTLEPKIGEPGYLNKNCWVVGNLKANPYKRCQYCKSRFRNCLFLQYQAISAFLIVFFIILSFFIKEKIPEIELILLIVFSFVIIYGYFFNKSTDRLIQAYFTQTKAKEALEELAKGLESQVEQRTKELKETNQKLIEMDRLKAGMYSFVSHQLRAPMGVIKDFAQLIYDGSYGEVSDKVKERLLEMKKSVDRQLELIDDFLDLRKIEEGKMEYHFIDVDIVGLVRSVVEELRLLAEEKGLELIFREQLTLIVRADEQRLRQVIFNLVENAIKYTERGFVKTTIDYDRNNNSVLITVSDSGLGIASEILPDIFTEFKRIQTAKKIKGSGLGLYIAKQIIEAHNGEIWAESDGEDKGSRFYVKLNPYTKRGVAPLAQKNNSPRYGVGVKVKG